MQKSAFKQLVECCVDFTNCWSVIACNLFTVYVCDFIHWTCGIYTHVYPHWCLMCVHITSLRNTHTFSYCFLISTYSSMTLTPGKSKIQYFFWLFPGKNIIFLALCGYILARFLYFSCPLTFFCKLTCLSCGMMSLLSSVGMTCMCG